MRVSKLTYVLDLLASGNVWAAIQENPEIFGPPASTPVIVRLICTPSVGSYKTCYSLSIYTFRPESYCQVKLQTVSSMGIRSGMFKKHPSMHFTLSWLRGV